MNDLDLLPTPRHRPILQQSHRIAHEMGQPHGDMAHLILAILEDPQAQQVLADAGVKTNRIESKIRRLLKSDLRYR